VWRTRGLGWRPAVDTPEPWRKSWWLPHLWLQLCRRQTDFCIIICATWWWVNLTAGCGDAVHRHLSRSQAGVRWCQVRSLTLSCILLPSFFPEVLFPGACQSHVQQIRANIELLIRCQCWILFRLRVQSSDTKMFVVETADLSYICVYVLCTFFFSFHSFILLLFFAKGYLWGIPSNKIWA
jgi:hypothetical protein